MNVPRSAENKWVEVTMSFFDRADNLFEETQIMVVLAIYGGWIGYFTASAWMLAHGARKATRLL